MVTTRTQSIPIGVSSCLLGHNVRYDGRNKSSNRVLTLCEVFYCIAICPETGIGLGVPRAPVNIIRHGNHDRLKLSTNPELDFTNELIDYARHVKQSHPELCGYIFKSRSPSCGLQSSPYFDEKGFQLGETDGIYSCQIQRLYPGLPIVEETGLQNTTALKKFQEAVIQYAEEHGVMN